MLQKHKRESSPDSIGEPINDDELMVGVQMKQRRQTATGGGGGGKSSNSLDFNGCDAPPSASAGDRKPASPVDSPSSAAATITIADNGGGNRGGMVAANAGAGGSTSVVSVQGCNKPNSSTSSVVVNLPASYPNSEMDYGSYPPSPASKSSNNDKPQVRITFL